MRIFDSKDAIRYGKIEELDDSGMKRIARSIDAIKAINVGIWTIVEQNSYPHWTLVKSRYWYILLIRS